MFGIILTLIAFEIGVFIRNKWRNPLLNPILIATVLIIGFLTVTGIDYDTYKAGGDYISFFLGPVTVILAVPLYRHIQAFKSHWFPILAGITVGCITSITCVIACGKIFSWSKTLMLSILPKSITIPMGSVVSEQIGGIPSVTIVAIVITGITGAVTAPLVCRFFRIKNPIAQGVAIGTSSHALGTTKAMEIGEVHGAMSSLSIGVAGVITVFITPVLLKVFA